jgi:hypothetical protein
MALKADAIAKIEKLLKVTGLAAAIADANEVDVTIEDSLTVLTEAEISTLRNNEYNSGKKSGIEIAVKEAKDKEGLEFTGKTIEALLEAKAKKVIDEAKIKPNEKVTELEGKIATLQTTVKDFETKLTEKDGEVSTIKVNTGVMKDMPANLMLPGEKVLTLMRADGYDFKIENNSIATYKDGKLIQDKLSNALPVKDVLSTYATEQKIITDAVPPGGRGGGNEGGQTKYSKLSEMEKKWKDEGKNVLGEEFIAAAQKAKADDPNFDMSN